MSDADGRNSEAVAFEDLSEVSEVPRATEEPGPGGMHQEREETEGVVGVLKIGQNVCKGRYLSKK